MNLISSLFKSFLALFKKIDVQPGQCATRYPILLVHGISMRDNWLLPSWGRIPKYLRRGGADVYLANTEAWASYETNAQHIKNKIEEILKKTGKAKVNIIAHSKGGVDARYAISCLGLGEKVASLTTVCTPHRGTCVADVITDRLKQENVSYDIVDFVARVFGDKHPQSNRAVKELRCDNMQKFNEEVLDVKGVFYQSYGAHMLNAGDDPLFLTYTLVKDLEGENDGMVSLDSLRWGEFQQIVEGNVTNTGLSHGQISGVLGEIVADVNIPSLYVGWVERLKAKGF